MSTTTPAATWCRAMALVSVLGLGLSLGGCGKGSTPKTANVEVPPTSQPTENKENKTAELAQESTAIKAELAAYEARRKPRPNVIGGCEEACQTPQGLVGLLLDALEHENRIAKLRPLFDWSLLRVDGEEKGARWSDMWGDYRKRDARNAEIDTWLKSWSAWVERMDAPGDLVKTRMSGVRVKPIEGRTDVVELAIRHPRLKDDTTEATWRFEVTRRGYEWLISRIDHRPSKRTKDPPPKGSVAPGRL